MSTGPTAHRSDVDDIIASIRASHEAEIERLQVQLRETRERRDATARLIRELQPRKRRRVAAAGKAKQEPA